MDQVGSKFELIHQCLTNSVNCFSVKELCAMNGVSRSGYYRWLNAESQRELREEQDKKDFELILQAYKSNGRHKGAKEIQMTLMHMDTPVVMNLKKIRRLMKKFNLRCPIRKANPYRRMAQAIKTNNVSDNLVNREFEAHGPRMVLLTDITYVPIPGNGPKKFAYLSTILDAYTKQILAYKISDNLQVDFVLATVNQLFENHGEELSADTMLHSDQGCHYTSISYIELLKNKKLRQSMSRRGNCWDNSPQESFFGHMKDEIKEMLQGCRTYEQVEALLEEQIDYYNNHRYQWKLAKLSPNEFYEYYVSGKYPIEGVKVPESRHKV
jgi:transposase InsO family protein